MRPTNMPGSPEDTQNTDDMVQILYKTHVSVRLYMFVTRLTRYAESLCIPEHLSVLLDTDQSDGIKSGQNAAVEATRPNLDR